MTTILPWLTCTEDIDTTHILGEDFQQLDQLYAAGWKISGNEYMQEITGGCIYLHDDAEGMLIPESNSDEIGVYLKFVTQRYRRSTSMIAVKIGYLPKNSVLKDISRPTVTRLRCSDTYYDLIGRQFEVKIVITPRKISAEEYHKHAMGIEDLR
jgi:hypothetical protein